MEGQAISFPLRGSLAGQLESNVEHEFEPPLTQTDELEKIEWCLGGQLGQLLEMPWDVLFEVLGHLHPQDLLNLARTTKALRNTLMHRSARVPWMQSLADAGLPPCPSDLSEPQYACLAFDLHCHFCNVLGKHVVLWTCRVRACQSCINENFVSWAWLQEQGLEGFPYAVKCIPWGVINKDIKVKRRIGFPKECVDQFRRRWHELVSQGTEAEQDLEEFLQGKMREISVKRQHAVLCQSWADTLKRERGMADVFERLRAMACGDEISTIRGDEFVPWTDD